MIDYLLIIQARLTSNRLPNKVMQTINGVPIVRRIWLAARQSKADHVIVAWPERYPDVDENNVLERFRRISREFPSTNIIRITSDCPLITSEIINDAIIQYESNYENYYYCNRDRYPDGFDVQVFKSWLLDMPLNTHEEHVLTCGIRRIDPHHLSVDTAKDLERVRKICAR